MKKVKLKRIPDCPITDKEKISVLRKVKREIGLGQGVLGIRYSGMCSAVHALYNNRKNITDVQYKWFVFLIRKALMLIFWYEDDTYMFPAYDIKPRIHWLNEQILLIKSKGK